MAAPPRLRRRDGEKLALFRRDLPLPYESAEEVPGPLPETGSALAEPWAHTGTESERGA